MCIRDRLGATFVHDGVELRRHARVSDPERGGTGRPGIVYVTAPDGTKTVSYTHLDVYKRQT